MRRQFRREAREELDKRDALDKRDDGRLDGQDVEVAVQRGPGIAVAVDDIDAPPRSGSGRGVAASARGAAPAAPADADGMVEPGIQHARGE